jgi:hypothetical protein
MGKQRKRRAPPKPIKRVDVKATDIPNMVDAIFDGDHEMPGWVLMCAGPRGRKLVNALFPDAHIEWSRRKGFSPDFYPIAQDWLGFKIHVPGVVSELGALGAKTNLPLDLIPAGQLIEDCTPEQAAMLLAFGVTRAGGSAAIVRRTVPDDHTGRSIYLQIFRSQMQ